MTKKKKSIVPNILAYIGLLIVIGWFVAMIAINDYYLRSHTVLIMLPIAIGFLLFSIGIAANIKGLLLKVVLIILNTIFFTYFTYWLLAIVFVGRYGIGS